VPTAIGDLVYSVREMGLILQDTLEREQATLGLEAVYFGSTLVPTYPVAVVEIGEKSRVLKEAGSRFQINFTLFVNILHGKVQDGSASYNETSLLAEAVEEVLHADYTLGGRIIFGAVTRSTPGVVRTNTVMLKAHRLRWEGISKEGF